MLSYDHEARRQFAAERIERIADDYLRAPRRRWPSRVRPRPQDPPVAAMERWAQPSRQEA